MSEVLVLMEKAECQHPDFIEVRLDGLDKHNRLTDITNLTSIPLIATNRSIKLHGNFSGSEIKRKKILLDAGEKGFDYVDVEMETQNYKDMANRLREIGVKPIISFHDFYGTPSLSKLNKILKKQIQNKAYLCKIVNTSRSFEDNITTFNFVSKASRNARVVCFSMGKLGKLSRLLCPLFGSFFTIASLEKERKTAIGQMTIQQMRNVYKILGLM
jgi:3-dehydroquinate dehydratase-1